MPVDLERSFRGPRRHDFTAARPAQPPLAGPATTRHGRTGHGQRRPLPSPPVLAPAATNTPARARAADWVEIVRVILVVAVLIGLAAYRQPYWPTTWIDEGFVMAGAEALVDDGRYAMQSADGWRTLDQPLIANGPGVVMPVAVAMRVLGVGLWQARVAAMLFMVLCGLLIYRTARQVGGPAGGLAALAIVVAIPREGFLYFGRMAMGNVPALAYVLCGVLVWIAAGRSRRTAMAFTAGALFGLAAITKAQWSLILLPALALTWTIDWMWLHRGRALDFAAAAAGTVAVITAWHLAQWVLLGTDGYLAGTAGVRASARWTVFALDPARYTAGSVHYLVRSGIAVVWITALAYTIWLCAERHAMAVHAVFLSAVATVWYAWYALVSVGWQRYAFEPTVISAVLSGAALGRAAALWSAARASRNRLPHWLGMTLAAALVGYVAVHGARRAAELTAAPDRSVQDFAAYLEAHVDARAFTESWEWQLDVFTERAMHHPTNDWVDDYTAQVFGGVPVARTYPWRERAPEYLVDGPFSKFTGIYTRDLQDGCCALEASRGPYDLYRVRRPSAARSDAIGRDAAPMAATPGE